MILHIITRSDWAAAETAGEIRTESLATHGFVHCSDLGTVHLPANRLYAGCENLLLAVIDPALVPAAVRWEPGDPPMPGGPWFPHVYGPIPVSAVVATHPFPPGRDGTFTLPAAIAGSGKLTCQEIIDQQQELCRQFERHDPDPADRRDPEPLRAMRKAVTDHAQAEADLADAIADARTASYSWAAIGAIIGISGEAVRQRYGQHIHESLAVVV